MATGGLAAGVPDDEVRMLFSTGTFDIVEPSSPGSSLPMRLTNLPDRGRTVAQLILILPTLLAMLAPAATASYLLALPGPSASLRYDAVTIAALGVLPILWLALALYLVMLVVNRVSRQRVVTMTADQVSALEVGIGGAWSWQIPVRAYRGIAHHVRASAGTVAHEVILVHEDPKRSVLLHSAPVVSQDTIDRYCGLLRLPSLAAREVYRRRRYEPARPRIADIKGLANRDLLAGARA